MNSDWHCIEGLSGDLLARIKINTIIKVTDFNWWSHSAGDPYIQISVDCLALSGTGDSVRSNVQESAKYGDYARVAELADRYSPGSLHWINSHAFYFAEDELHFYDAKTKVINAVDAENIGGLFSRQSDVDSSHQKDLETITVNTSNINKDMSNSTVTISGFIESLRIARTKRGLRMAYAKLNDQSGAIDLIIFPNVYDAYENALQGNDRIAATGKLDVSENASFLIPDSFEFLEG